MTTYKPPIKAPKVYGEGVQQPPRMQYVIQTSKSIYQAASDLSEVANRIVDFYSSNITAFVDTQRRGSNLGVTVQDRRQMTVPGLSVDYARSGGDETIKITVYPEEAPPPVSGLQIDLNYDGYWAMNIQSTLGDPEVPAPWPGGALDIIVNGYAVYVDWTPPVPPFFQTTIDVSSSENPAGLTGMTTFAVAFGATALLGASLLDPKNENPLIQKGGTFPLGGPPGTLLPPAPEKAASGNIPKHPEVPGYFPFDWSSQLNPNILAYDDQTGFVKYFEGVTHFNVGPYNRYFQPARLALIVQFEDVANSPLVKTGPNYTHIQSHLTPTYRFVRGFITDINPSIGGGSYWSIAEFYDRDTLRPVNQSWKYIAQPPGQILVNDKPLGYAIEGNTLGQYQEGFSMAARDAMGFFTSILAFDLSPKPKETIVVYGDNNYVQHDSFGSDDAIYQTDGYPLEIPPTQAVIDWSAEITADIATLEAAVNTETTALSAATGAYATDSNNGRFLTQNSSVNLAYQYALAYSPIAKSTALAELEATLTAPTPVNMTLYATAALAFTAACNSGGDFSAALNALNSARHADIETFNLTAADYPNIVSNGFETLVAFAAGNTASMNLSSLESFFFIAATEWGNYLTTNGHSNSIITEALAVNAASSALHAALLVQPALPGPIPTGGYKTMPTTWKYRVITVSGDQGSYSFQVGAWQGGQ